MEDTMITLKDAYQELWHCRDFELSNLWQRSIFLGTFLLAVFAGYGAVVLNCMDHGLSNRPMVNLVCFGLSIIGIVLSIFWIMMAKGSKAWYERYEKAICHFREIADLGDKQKKQIEESADRIIAFNYGNCFANYSDVVSSWLWNTRGGAYSPSKINIAIGHLSFFMWLLLSIVHIAVAAGMVVSEVLRNMGPKLPAVMMFVILLGLLLLWIYIRISLKSSVLEEKDEK